MSKWSLSLCLHLLLVGTFAGAEPVTMLEETYAIECEFPKGSAYDRLVVDRREAELSLFKEQKAVAKFDRLKFLDSALILKAKGSEDYALFQIFLNGEVLFTRGDLLSFMEKDCDDTGASKTCKASGFKKLYWSPERLALEYPKGNVGAGIDTYGFLANHATYFHAMERSSRAMTLIDYGAPLDLIVGPAHKVKCKYQRP